MRPIRTTKALATADDDNIAASQTPAGAGNLTLNGVAAAGSPAIATLDTSRQVLFTFAGDEHSRTFVVYGFDRPSGGNPIQETVTGTTPGTVATTKEFGQVTRISVDAGTAGALKVGTNGVGSTPWFLVDWYISPSNLTIAVDVVGTVNYTVQYTYDDIMGYTDPQGLVWNDGYPTKIWDDPVLAASTSDGETTYDNPIVAWRVKINSSTAPGSLRITGVQAGIADND